MASARIPSRYAYVALLMKGNGYLPGVKALSASLKATGTTYDFVLMVTSDVDMTLLQPYADYVVQVPYLQYETQPMKTAKQRDMYARWMDAGYTKWNALTLNQYIKVLLLDLDIVVLENLDSLFELAAPAATFSNAWATPYVKGKGGLFNPYLKVKHGEQVPPEAIREGLKRSFVLIGTTVLLEPSHAVYEEFKQFMETHQPYGNSGCYSAMDEQSLSEFYTQRGTVFRHISQKWNMVPWHAKLWLPQGEKAAVAHFFGDKPWNTKRDAWPDLKIWWHFYDAAAQQES
jgi:lipopolysaccharide biosynthesis glycosyltransferase